MFLWCLAAGILVRCIALTQPLVDAHPMRQCQTAAATRDLWESPGFSLSSHIPWIGDHTQSYLQELPIYNFLTMGVNVLARDLTLSGKVVSVSLWAISFFLLQGIWRRVLDPPATAWANLLFVVAPLGVFFGQAVMPEMLVQALAFGFLLLLVRYEEEPTLPRWAACAAVGFVGLLVKAPEISHLYLILVALFVRCAGWRALFRPRHIVAGLLSAAGLFAWCWFLNLVNASSYAFGSAGSSITGFIGPLAMRFHLQPWLMIGLYLGAFLVPGVAVLAVGQGARVLIARPTFLLATWLGSVAFFYVFWFGNAAAGQSYYNLPALGPLCALFGMGMASLLARPRWRSRPAAVVAVLLVVAGAVPGWFYLFRQDRAILAATLWTRNNTAPRSLILVSARHRADMEDYGANAVFSYLTRRPTFIWSSVLEPSFRNEILDRSQYAIVTIPLPEGEVMTAIRKLRGLPNPPRPSMDWLLERGFSPVAEGPGFVAFRRQ